MIPLPSSNSPEGIAAWLKWYDSLEPFIVSEKKEAETEEWIKKCDQYEAEKQNQDIKDLFPESNFK